jgi:hypothetical protein
MLCDTQHLTREVCGTVTPIGKATAGCKRQVVGSTPLGNQLLFTGTIVGKHVESHYHRLPETLQVLGMAAQVYQAFFYRSRIGQMKIRFLYPTVGL